MQSTPGIILQARLTSERFPNKVLCPLLGKPIIQWIIEALEKTKLPWVIAIPENKTDLGINSWCKEYGDRTGTRIRMSFGAKEDLIIRYLKTNEVAKFDPIIRVCGDSPFIAPEDIKLALEIYNQRGYFTYLNHVQVFSQKELEHQDDTDPFVESRQHAGTRGMAYVVDYPEDIVRITRDWNEGSPTMDGLKKLWNINKKE